MTQEQEPGADTAGAEESDVAAEATATAAPATQPNITQLNPDTFLGKVVQFVQAAEPYVQQAVTLAEGVATVVNPALGLSIQAGVGIASKIIQGVVDGYQPAVALYNQIVGGQTPTLADLQGFEADYEADYEALKADLAEKLAVAGKKS